MLSNQPVGHADGGTRLAQRRMHVDLLGSQPAMSGLESEAIRAAVGDDNYIGNAGEHAKAGEDRSLDPASLATVGNGESDNTRHRSGGNMLKDGFLDPIFLASHG